MLPIFDSDLPFHLSFNTNTFQMAIIISLGCKRKKVRSIVKTCRLRHSEDMLLSYTDGQDLMHKISCCIREAAAKHAYIRKSNHRRPPTENTFQKAEHVSVACINVSVRNAGCLSLKANVEVDKGVEKVIISIARRKTTKLSKGFSM